MSISELIEYLQGASDVAASNAQTASNKGITAGVGKAMKQGFNR
jgi:hypothetical protein